MENDEPKNIIHVKFTESGLPERPANAEDFTPPMNLEGFKPMDVDLRINGVVQRVTILARPAPRFDVVA